MARKQKRVVEADIELLGDFEARKEILLGHYDELVESAEHFCTQLRSFFKKAISKSEALRDRVQFVTGRVKDRDSFLRKISRPRKSPYTSLEQITDLVGLRVITLYETDIDQIAKLVRFHFDIDEENSVDKRKSHNTSDFGYLSRHLVFSVKKSRRRDVEWSQFSGIKAEIQIRSVAQHAWAEVEHGLGYHSRVTIPQPLRRRFARLAALLEIVDGEFVLLNQDVAAYRRKVERPSDSALVDVESLSGLVEHDSTIKNTDRRVPKPGSELNTNTSRDFIEFLVRMAEWLRLRHIGDVKNLVILLGPILKKYASFWITRNRKFDRGISVMYAFYFLVSAIGTQNSRQSFQHQFGLGRHVTNFDEMLVQSIADFPEYADMCREWAVQLQLTGGENAISPKSKRAGQARRGVVRERSRLSGKRRAGSQQRRGK